MKKGFLCCSCKQWIEVDSAICLAGHGSFACDSCLKKNVKNAQNVLNVQNVKSNQLDVRDIVETKSNSCFSR